MDYETFTEQVFFSTLRIEFPSKATMGTGFIVKSPSKVPGRVYTFLVSNKHVINDPRDILRIVFHSRDDDKATPNLNKHHEFEINKIADGAYYTHPSEDVDLACLNISDLLNRSDKFYMRMLDSSIMSDYNEPDLQAGKEILFVGYPEDRYDHAHNLPILRGGRIASLPKVDFEKDPVFLVDAPVFPGSSGSPVFAVLGGYYKLIGVVTQTMIKHQKLEMVEKAKERQLVAPQTIGIGLAYKSTCVKQLIDYATDRLNRLR